MRTQTAIFAAVEVQNFYMQRCLDLASGGLGRVRPNPVVGCVIVHDGKIIGEGFHGSFGGPHAEAEAIERVLSKYGKDILQSADLYVSLEPCAHTGKTPPCSELIIAQKIPSVIVGSRDPFSLVNGEGIRKLKEAGVSVTEGILEKECRETNRRFLTFHEKKRPYVILKWAQSLDRFIAPKKVREENRWITNEYSRILVHKWRSEEAAVWVGTNTVLVDNPRLTVRDWSGQNPIRVIVDRSLYLGDNSHVLNEDTPTLVFNESKDGREKNIEWIHTDFSGNRFGPMLDELYKRNVQSVLVEGGLFTLQCLIAQNLWDEARIFIGNKFLGEGLKAPEIDFTKTISEESVLDDRLFILRNN